MDSFVDIFIYIFLTISPPKFQICSYVYTYSGPGDSLDIFNITIVHEVCVYNEHY